MAIVNSADGSVLSSFFISLTAPNRYDYFRDAVFDEIVPNIIYTTTSSYLGAYLLKIDYSLK